MFHLDIGFDSPWYLLLLGVLPLLWIFSFRTLAGLGRWRRWFAIGLRSFVYVLFVLALAELQILRTSEKLTVLYLLDQSQSIPADKRQAMLKYAIEEVSKHRRAERGDQAGVIVFGGDAKIEIPPFDDNLPSIGRLESYFDLRTDATNLAAALKLAQASFPEGTAKRVVVITDGNENLGSAREAARSLADSGVGIDIVPVQLPERAEIAVEKVTLPLDIHQGQPFEVRVVISNYARPSADNPSGHVRGMLRLTQHAGESDQLIGEQPVVLEPGRNVFGFKHEIGETAMFTFEAVFTPDDPTQDRSSQNNRATAYTHVRGEGHVLLIEDWQTKGEFDHLANRLRAQNLEVTVHDSHNPFSGPVELLEYDTIILANVARSSGEDAAEITNFSDDQIRMLVRNTKQLGCGLVMLGGPNSFGAGGWTNTELEQAMPVDFQIKNAKIEAVGALVLLMHASEMADGNYWQKVVAAEAIKSLGPMDYCGLIHWGWGGDSWLWTDDANNGLIRISNRRNNMLARLDRMTPGDMPQFDPAMQMALAGFNNVKASVKHMIIISDGDPAKPAPGTTKRFADAGIKISTVAVGAHGPAGHQTLQDIAADTGGKYYVVTNPKALPKIYQREARRISRPLIHEPQPDGVQPIVIYPHEMLGDIDTSKLRRLAGYVLTTKKDHPLVEQSIIASDPDDGGRNSTLLASWNYGLGRTVVFTSDAGNLWARSWKSAEYYDRFFGNLVHWSMGPIKDQGKFNVATDYKDDRARIVVTALDKDDEFLNFLNMNARAAGPEGENFDVKMEQVAPGRYVGEFATDKPGSYLLGVMPGGNYATIRTGVNVPYSSEFRDRETNVGLLTTLASLKPDGGEAGTIIGRDVDNDHLSELLTYDTFRHNLPKAISAQDIWPAVILLAATMFFWDIFVRRVSLSFAWLVPVGAWIKVYVLRRNPAPLVDQRLERLRSQKAAIGQQLDQRRAATRFEPQPDAVDSAPPLGEVIDDVAGQRSTATPPARPPRSSTMAPGEVEEESYTARLLKAKKRALDDQHKKRPDK